MFGFFNRKKETDILRKDVEDSFNHVKQDFNKVGQWIKHIDEKQGSSNKEISELKDQILDIKLKLEEINEFISFFGPQLSKQHQTVRDKQTVAVDVQTPVQTAVQTGIFDTLTVMERAIIWALINSEMKLSYEDLAALLGKDRSTIRGQINALKQKSEGLIEEVRELNGKKRLYVPEKMKEFLLKSVKVRVKGNKKQKKDEKNN